MTATAPPSDDVLVLHRSKRKWIAVMLGCAAFTLVGVWALSDDPWMAVPAIAFFGPGTLAAAWVLFPGNSYLRLDRDGFAAKALYRTLRYSWDDVDNFRAHTVRTTVRGVTHTTHLVAFDLRGGPVAGSLSRRIERAITEDYVEIDAALHDTYGRNPSELAQLLQSYRDRYATGAGAPGGG